MEALKKYVEIKKTQKVDPNIKQTGDLFEACLSIIGDRFLQTAEKEAIFKLFNVMDDTGDGKIGSEELIKGFNKVLGEKLDEEEAKAIIAAVDIGEEQDNQIDKREFLTCTINYTNEENLVNYFEAAYSQFFNNDTESIDTQMLIDTLCSSKYIKGEYL